MSNPKKDLVEAITELRADVETQLKANKYYIALHKLDELLAAIKPLDAKESPAKPAESPRVEAKPAAEAEAKPAAEGEEVRTWSGVVQEPVRDSWRSKEGPQDQARAS
jgi:BMFP domain-containing protein YqiC